MSHRELLETILKERGFTSLDDMLSALKAAKTMEVIFGDARVKALDNQGEFLLEARL